ncbi:uncharacterized protein ATC70_005316 [Mucor velutinosus]|uniref:Pentatricopeptide repeat-containing protein n=1 Tax=Mucor velutinosus TaxID=708070 RepID=A0AAN7HZB7_9FUNG|nr:hypothetical protein ATC70_005316 [Mucor velutinosus]
MAQNILRTSTTKRVCLASTTNSTKHWLDARSFSSKTTGWFRRFLSPAEEKKLYFGITSSFREKLVEQSNKSAQTYSNIIEHAILSAKPVPSKLTKTGMLSFARIEQLKLDLDAAGKQRDIKRLNELEMEMNSADLKTVTMYNRLIRAYIWSDSLESAQHVLDSFEHGGMVPTTRTFTYLIQAYLKQNDLQAAKQLVEQMQHLSLLKLRNNFDCSIMLKYYQAAGDTHAIEYLWRDMMLHADVIKPGPGLFTQYLEYLHVKKDLNTITQLAHDFLLLLHSQQPLNPHQYVTWMKAVKAIATTTNTPQAEHLLFHLIKNAPPKISWDKAKDAMQQIVASYLAQEQELKAVAFYYKLGKLGVPDTAFEPQMVYSIEAVLQRIEEKNRLTTLEENKAVLAELEGLILAKV